MLNLSFFPELRINLHVNIGKRKFVVLFLLVVKLRLRSLLFARICSNFEMVHMICVHDLIFKVLYLLFCKTFWNFDNFSSENFINTRVLNGDIADSLSFSFFTNFIVFDNVTENNLGLVTRYPISNCFQALTLSFFLNSNRSRLCSWSSASSFSKHCLIFTLLWILCLLFR